MSVTVKICGITSEADAVAAAEAGADAIGLMFYEGSPRHVTVAEAKAISAALPPQIIRVGVFVNAEEALFTRAIAECTLNILQFHGDETPEDCGRFPVMTLKAFRMAGPETRIYGTLLPPPARALERAQERGQKTENPCASGQNRANRALS